MEKPKVKIGLGLAKIKGKKKRQKKNSIATTRLPGAVCILEGRSRTARYSLQSVTSDDGDGDNDDESSHILA